MDHMVKYGWPFIGTVIMAVTLQSGVKKVKISQTVLFLKNHTPEICKMAQTMIAMLVLLMITCSF